MTAPPSSTAPWDLSFLRVGALVTGVVAAAAAVVVGLLRGWEAVWGVVLGAVVVTGFFALSALVIAWAGRIGDAFTLPAALGTFVIKVLVLAGVLGSIPADGWIDRPVLAWTVIAAALLWGGVQMRWVWTRQMYYVPPPAAPGAAHRDPETPASRG